jgi:flagellar hook-length control protein FliK
VTYSNLAVSPAAAGAATAPHAAPVAPGHVDFADVLTRLTAKSAPPAGLRGWLGKTMARAATVVSAAVLDGVAAEGPVEAPAGVPIRPAAAAKPFVLPTDPSAVKAEDAPPGNPVAVDMTGLLMGASLVRLWTPAAVATGAQNPANQPPAADPQDGPATASTAVQMLQAPAAGVPVTPADEMPEAPASPTAAAVPVTEGSRSSLSRVLKALTSEGTLPVAVALPPVPETRTGSGMPVPIAAPGLLMSSAPGSRGSAGGGDPNATVTASRLPGVLRPPSPGLSGPAENAAVADALAADPSSAGSPLSSAGRASPDDAGGTGQQQPSHHPHATMAQHEIAAFQVTAAPALMSAGPVTVGGEAAPAVAAAGSGAEMVPQIVQAMKLQWSGGIGEAHLRLQPEYLGELTISIRVDRGVVSATLASEVPAVREWLQGHESLLRQGLADQGLQLDRLVVAGESRQADRENGEKPRPDRQPSPDHQPPPHKQSSPRHPPDEQTFEVVA